MGNLCRLTSLVALTKPKQAHGCTRLTWGRSGVLQKNANTLYNKNKLNIRRESVGNLCRLYKLGGLHQARAAHRHKQTRHTRRHKGSAREPQETGSKGTSPTAKAETLQKQCLRTPRLHKAGPHTQQQTAHTCSKPGVGQICAASQHTLVGQLRLGVDWK